MALLSDRALQDFITDGYAVIRPELPADFHRAAYRQTAEVLAADGNPGNDLLPRAPLLQRLLEDPAVDGALESVLGPGYILHRHRHCHDWGPQSQAQDWHKDYPAAGNVRCHRCRWALVFYYPQDVTEDMGPTAIQPGTQYYMGPTATAGMPLCVEAGTVIVAHYELWHRAMANTSDAMRYMHKFLFMRRSEPQPGQRAAAWRPKGEHTALRHAIWEWYCGRGGQGLLAAAALAEEEYVERTAALATGPLTGRRAAVDALAGQARAMGALAEALEDEDEGVRLNAAYALAACGAEGVAPLMVGLEREAAGRWHSNLERGDFTNPSQLDAIYGLAAAGRVAVPALVEALQADSWWLRAAAAAALGCMGRPAAEAAGALARTVADDNEWVRRNSADALGHIGQRGDPVVQGLIKTLADRRPVTAWSLGDDPLRENALAALARLGTVPQEAVETLTEAGAEGNEYVRDWVRIALEGQAPAAAAG